MHLALHFSDTGLHCNVVTTNNKTVTKMETMTNYHEAGTGTKYDGIFHKVGILRKLTGAEINKSFFSPGARSLSPAALLVLF